MKKEAINIDLIILIISSFYCVPLLDTGFIVQSDIRLYDFVFIFYIFKNKNYLRLKNKDPKLANIISSVHYLLLAFLLGFIISTVLNLNLNRTAILFIRLVRICNYLLAFTIIVNKYKTINELKTLVYTFYFCCSISAIIALLQHENILPLFWPTKWLGNYRFVNWPTAFLSPHHLQIGFVMGIMCALSVSFIIFIKNIILKIFNAFLILLAIYIIFITESRTGMVISIFAILLPLIGNYRKTEGVLFIAIAFVISMFFFNKLLENSTQIYDRVVVQQIEKKNTLSHGRSALLEEYLEIAFKHPWVILSGAGFQNFSMVSNKNNAAHNNYIQYWYELGFLGISSFILLLWRLYALFFSNYLYFLKIKQNFLTIINRGFLGIFVPTIIAMLFNEIIYPQYALFTLPFQALCILSIPILVYKIRIGYYNKINPLKSSFVR